MIQNNKPFTLYIAIHYNETEAKEIGIRDGDFTGLIDKLEEYNSFLSNAGILTSSCETILNLLKATDIQYQTEATYNSGNIIYICDGEKFKQICSPNSETVHEAWLSVIHGLSWDIDECIERYGCIEVGNFFKSLLVYITQFDIVTK